MLVDKLNEFKAAVDAIKVALVAQGVAVSAYTLASAAQLVGQVQTSRSMGSRSVTFKQNAVIYGIKITESEKDSEKRVTYTNDAKGMVPVSVTDTSTTYNQWNKTWLYEAFKPVMLKSNGTVDYYLNPSNYKTKSTGGTSDYDNDSYDGNAMVQIKKFYIKFSMDGEDELIQLSNVKLTGYDAIGFIRSDDSEAPYVYVGMYLGDINTDKQRYRSIGGSRQGKGENTTNMLLSTKILAAQKNGSSNYSIETYPIRQMLQTVSLTMFKTCNTYSILSDYSVSAIQDLLYSTGAISRRLTNNQYMKEGTHKFMHIHEFLSLSSNHPGGTRDELGMLFQNGHAYIKMKPPYSLTSISDYTIVPDNYKEFKDRNTNYGSHIIKKMVCSNQYGRYPIEYEAGAYNSYEDSVYEYTCTEGNQDINSSTSYYGGTQLAGTASRGGYNPFTRLTYLPPA